MQMEDKAVVVSSGAASAQTPAEIRMTDDAGNTAFRGRGLFAKYVFSLVGLVLFVLAVNSAIETFFIYRETQSSLIGAMAEKADATATRIENFMTETERQISWVTRASSTTL
jgi:adenylate cyclase